MFSPGDLKKQSSTDLKGHDRYYFMRNHTSNVDHVEALQEDLAHFLKTCRARMTPRPSVEYSYIRLPTIFHLTDGNMLRTFPLLLPLHSSDDQLCMPLLQKVRSSVFAGSWISMWLMLAKDVVEISRSASSISAATFDQAMPGQSSVKSDFKNAHGGTDPSRAFECLSEKICMVFWLLSVVASMIRSSCGISLCHSCLPCIEVNYWSDSDILCILHAPYP